MSIITNELLEALLASGESDTLDFKEKIPNIDNNDEFLNLVKDITCMSNTIRSAPAMIIFGVSERKNSEGVKEFKVIGIDKASIPDTAKLTDKLRSYLVNPPSIECTPFVTKNKIRIWCISIPIVSFKIIPSKGKDKFFEKGKLYIRKGTQNTEGLPDDIIAHENWINTLRSTGSRYQYFSPPRPISSFNENLTQQNLENFKFTEENIHNIIGNEAAEDEDVERLKSYYLKFDIFNKINVETSLRIIVGHKGVGKSAIVKVMKEDNMKDNKLALFLKPNDLTTFGKSTSNDFIERIESWKRGLMGTIFESTLKQFGITIERSELTSICENFNSINYMDQIFSFIEQSKDHVENYELKEIYNKFRETKKLYIYLDDLDRGWTGSQNDIQRLSALLNAIRDFTQDNRGVFFRVTFRTDVFYMVRTSDESTDKIQSSVIWLEWSNKEILLMLVKRIASYFSLDFTKFDSPSRLKNMTQDEITLYTDKIISKYYDGIGKWNNVYSIRVLQTIVRKRPRDLVKFLTLAARKAANNDRNVISTEDIYSVLDEYSSDRFQDIINEHSTELPNIASLLNAFVPSKNKPRGSEEYLFSKAELIKKINNIQGPQIRFAHVSRKASSEELAKFLFKIGFVTCREVVGEQIRWIYFEDSKYLMDVPLSEEYVFEVHPAYRWALQSFNKIDIFSYIPLVNE